MGEGGAAALRRETPFTYTVSNRK